MKLSQQWQPSSSRSHQVGAWAQAPLPFAPPVSSPYSSSRLRQADQLRSPPKRHRPPTVGSVAGLRRATRAAAKTYREVSNFAELADRFQQVQTKQTSTQDPSKKAPKGGEKIQSREADKEKTKRSLHDRVAEELAHESKAREEEEDASLRSPRNHLDPSSKSRLGPQKAAKIPFPLSAGPRREVTSLRPRPVPTLRPIQRAPLLAQRSSGREATPVKSKPLKGRAPRSFAEGIVPPPPPSRLQANAPPVLQGGDGPTQTMPTTTPQLSDRQKLVEELVHGHGGDSWEGSEDMSDDASGSALSDAEPASAERSSSVSHASDLCGRNNRAQTDALPSLQQPQPAQPSSESADNMHVTAASTNSGDLRSPLALVGGLAPAGGKGAASGGKAVRELDMQLGTVSQWNNSEEEGDENLFPGSPRQGPAGFSSQPMRMHSTSSTPPPPPRLHSSLPSSPRSCRRPRPVSVELPRASSNPSATAPEAASQLEQPSASPLTGPTPRASPPRRRRRARRRGPSAQETAFAVGPRSLSKAIKRATDIMKQEGHLSHLPKLQQHLFSEPWASGQILRRLIVLSQFEINDSVSQELQQLQAERMQLRNTLMNMSDQHEQVVHLGRQLRTKEAVRETEDGKRQALEKQVNRLKQQNQLLRARLDGVGQEQDKTNNFEEESRRYRDAVVQLKQQLSKAQEGSQKVETERGELSRKLKALTGQHEQQALVLQRKVFAADHATRSLQHLNNKLRMSEQEIKMLKVDLTFCKSSESNQKPSRPSMLSRTSSVVSGKDYPVDSLGVSMPLQLPSQDVSRVDLKKHLESERQRKKLEQQVKELQSTVASLTQDNLEKQKAASSWKIKMFKLTASNTQLQERVKNKSKTISSLKKELADVKREDEKGQQELRTVKRELALCRNSLGEEKMERKRLEVMLDQSAEEERRESERVLQLKSEIAGMEEEVIVKASLVRSHEEEAAELRANEVALLNQHRRGLELAQEGTKAANRKTHALEQREILLLQQVENFNQEIASLKETVDARELSLEKAQKQNGDLEETVAGLQTKLAAGVSKFEALELVHFKCPTVSRLQEQKREILDLQKQLHSLREHLGTEQLGHSAAQQQLASTEKRLENEEIHRKLVVLKNSELEAQRHSASSTAELLKKKLADKEQLAKELAGEVRKFKGWLATERKDHEDDVKAHTVSRMQSDEEFQQRIQRLEAELEGKTVEIHRLQDRADKTKKLLVEITTELDSTNKDFDVVSERCHEMEKKHSLLQGTSNIAIAKLQTLQKEQSRRQRVRRAARNFLSSAPCILHGIEVQEAEDNSVEKLVQGPVVASVVPQVGLESEALRKGVVIASVDGKATRTLVMYQLLVPTLTPGTRVSVTVYDETLKKYSSMALNVGVLGMSMKDLMVVRRLALLTASDFNIGAGVTLPGLATEDLDEEEHHHEESQRGTANTAEGEKEGASGGEPEQPGDEAGSSEAAVAELDEVAEPVVSVDSNTAD